MEWETGRENWKVLAKFFPANWEEMAKTSGALQRQRKLKSATDLLRLLLIHLADGCSMREAVTRAKQGGVVSISDVALLKRLRSSSEWFRLMALELLKRRGVETKAPAWLSSYNVLSLDASVITEPGSTGTDWRLHYSLKLFGLYCEQFLITRPAVGESFVNFKVKAGDLIIGDRVYGSLKGFQFVKKHRGDFLVRFKPKAFQLCRSHGRSFDLLSELHELSLGKVGDWYLQASTGGGRKLAVRLCAIRKSEQAADEAIIKMHRTYKKKQKSIDPKTLELQRFVILITSLENSIEAKLVMELYRFRWQIEIAFKRLKSIMGLGHLPKIDEASARAWLHGKLFVALLAQAIVDEGRFFSPWGYPI